MNGPSECERPVSSSPTLGTAPRVPFAILCLVSYHVLTNWSSCWVTGEVGSVLPPPAPVSLLRQDSASLRGGKWKAMLEVPTTFEDVQQQVHSRCRLLLALDTPCRLSGISLKPLLNTEPQARSR